MNCYRHSNISSVGLCKSCFKAVCPDCAADVGNGLACKDSCEVKVLELNEMWERSAKIYGIGNRKSRLPSSGVLVWFLLSMAMWVVTGLTYYKGRLDYGNLVMALIFSIICLISYFSAKRTGIKC